MSTSSWEFAHNLALASTGLHQVPSTDCTISHIEQGVYRLSIDKSEIALTAQDLIDVMDFVLVNYRTLLEQAKEQEAS